MPSSTVYDGLAQGRLMQMFQESKEEIWGRRWLRKNELGSPLRFCTSAQCRRAAFRVQPPP